MTQLLIIGVCLAFIAIVFYVRHSIEAAYFEGRYDELIESQPWNKLQCEIAHMQGCRDTIDCAKKTMPDITREFCRAGRLSAIQPTIYQNN